MSTHDYIRLFFTTTVLQVCWCYPDYQGRIPNGNKVPNPCRQEETWPGVGHQLVEGSGARNPFGLDFFANGKQWTRALCETDSDNDGLTNGFELGDPNCTWTPGQQLPAGLTISHPGVCEPWNDPKCLAQENDWVMDVCQPKEFNCLAINRSIYMDVESRTFRLPSLVVPAKEKTYMCQIFLAPDQDYHMIATTPLIDNTKVVHHIMLYGCDQDVPTTFPFECGMSPHRNCTDILSVWTPGSAGQCLHSDVGFRLGRNGYRKIALQIHWNNPSKRSDYSDESGMVLYLTPNLRKQNAGILTAGQTHLWIPPQEPQVTREGVFNEECSKRDLRGNIYITSVLNHMHYLGTYQSLILYRNGRKERDIAIDKQYNYDNPKLHVFSEPIEVRPGDELRTKCVYSTMSRNYTTTFGDATSDEMCYSFITYYPKDNARRNTITSVRSIGLCNVGDGVYLGCNIRTFPDLSDLETVNVINSVNSECNLFEHCTQECFNAVQTAKLHNCMKGDIWDILVYRFLRSVDGVGFILRLRSCDLGVPEEAPPVVQPIEESQSTCDWPGLVAKQQGHALLVLYENVLINCVGVNICLKECIPAVMDARRHPCFQGAEWEFGRRYLFNNYDAYSLEFLVDFESCNCEIQGIPCKSESTTISTTVDTTDSTTGRITESTTSSTGEKTTESSTDTITKSTTSSTGEKTTDSTLERITQSTTSNTVESTISASCKPTARFFTVSVFAISGLIFMTISK